MSKVNIPIQKNETRKETHAFLYKRVDATGQFHLLGYTQKYDSLEALAGAIYAGMPLPPTCDVVLYTDDCTYRAFGTTKYYILPRYKWSNQCQVEIMERLSRPSNLDDPLSAEPDAMVACALVGPRSGPNMSHLQIGHALLREAEQWLFHNFPAWRDPCSYWDASTTSRDSEETIANRVFQGDCCSMDYLEVIPERTMQLLRRATGDDTSGALPPSEGQETSGDDESRSGLPLVDAARLVEKIRQQYDVWSVELCAKHDGGASCNILGRHGGLEWLGESDSSPLEAVEAAARSWTVHRLSTCTAFADREQILAAVSDAIFNYPSNGSVFTTTGFLSAINKLVLVPLTQADVEGVLSVNPEIVRLSRTDSPHVQGEFWTHLPQGFVRYEACRTSGEVTL